MNRKIIVASVLIIGFLMTYISRLPLAFERGANWIYSYIPAGDAQAWILFNAFHAASLAPLILFSFFYLRGKIRLTFHLSVLAHIITTFFLYYNYEPRRAEDVINFFLFPVIIALVAMVAGSLGYLIERKTAAVD